MYLYSSIIVFLQKSTDVAKDWPSTTKILGQFFSLTLVIIIVVLLAHYSTKFFAKVSLNRGRNTNLSVIESIGIGYQQNIQLIRVCNKYIVVGVSKEKMVLLTELSEEEAMSLQNNKENLSIDKFKFNDVLEKIISSKNKK